MRRLTLKSETLVALTTDELTGVAGGATPLCPLTPTNQATLCHLCAITPEIRDLTDRFTEQTCTW